jgi:iron complex transport system ATP-binding protein
VCDLNREQGRTVVLVLHDLNMAARYADLLVAMKDGRIVASGPPAAVLTKALVREVFEVEARIMPDPRTGTPLVLPLGSVAAEPVRTIAIPTSVSR